MGYWIAETKYPDEVFVTRPQVVQRVRVQGKIRQDAKRVAPEMADIMGQVGVEYAANLHVKNQVKQLKELGFVMIVTEPLNTIPGRRPRFIICDDKFKDRHYEQKKTLSDSERRHRKEQLRRERESWSDAENALDSL